MPTRYSVSAEMLNAGETRTFDRDHVDDRFSIAARVKARPESHAAILLRFG
jgi:hypothetical protein